MEMREFLPTLEAFSKEVSSEQPSRREEEVTKSSAEGSMGTETPPEGDSGAVVGGDRENGTPGTGGFERLPFRYVVTDVAQV